MPKTRRRGCGQDRATIPLPVEQLKAIIASYPKADDFVWAQESLRIWEPTVTYAHEFQSREMETGLAQSLRSTSRRKLPVPNAATPMPSGWCLTRNYFNNHEENVNTLIIISCQFALGQTLSFFDKANMPTAPESSSAFFG
jgi:hypothetical protein